MLTKIAGKRYAYKFDFSALKLSCEAQQNPMPSDTKQEELHAIMAPFLPAIPSSAPASAATAAGVGHWPFSASSVQISKHMAG